MTRDANDRARARKRQREHALEAIESMQHLASWVEQYGGPMDRENAGFVLLSFLLGDCDCEHYDFESRLGICVLCGARFRDKETKR